MFDVVPPDQHELALAIQPKGVDEPEPGLPRPPRPRHPQPASEYEPVNEQQNQRRDDHARDGERD
jgi:hypothetical protein